jgi:hypothetical protein
LSSFNQELSFFLQSRVFFLTSKESDFSDLKESSLSLGFSHLNIFTVKQRNTWEHESSTSPVMTNLKLDWNLKTELLVTASLPLTETSPFFRVNNPHELGFPHKLFKPGLENSERYF